MTFFPRAALEKIRAVILMEQDSDVAVREITEIIHDAFHKLENPEPTTADPRDADPSYAPDGLRWTDRRR